MRSKAKNVRFIGTLAALALLPLTLSACGGEKSSEHGGRMGFHGVFPSGGMDNRCRQFATNRIEKCRYLATKQTHSEGWGNRCNSLCGGQENL